MEVLKIIQTVTGKQLIIELPERFISKKLEILVFPADDEEESWQNQNTQTLNRAYSSNEPDYTVNMLKEPNQEYGER